MENKILTIVVPCYNVEEFIEKCLSSIVNTDVLNLLEVLIVNDGSLDNSVYHARKFEADYPQTFHVIDKTNGGHGSTINIGIQKATAKYFMVLDGDDWINSEELKKLVYNLSNIDVDLVSFHYTRVVNGEKITIENNSRYFEYEKIYCFDKLNLKKMYFVLSSICYKTKILKDCKLTLFEKMSYVDLQYIIKPIVNINTVIFYNLNIYCYRLGHNNQSVNINNMLDRYNQHDTIIKDLVIFYNNQNSMSKEKKIYIMNVLLRVACTQYHLSLTHDPDLDRANKNAQKFDQFLKDKNIILYKKMTRKIFLLRKVRKSGFNIRKYRNSWILKFKNRVRDVTRSLGNKCS